MIGHESRERARDVYFYFARVKGAAHDCDFGQAKRQSLCTVGNNVKATCSLHRVPIDHVRQLSLLEPPKFAIGVIKMTSGPLIRLIYKANVNGSYN